MKKDKRSQLSTLPSQFKKTEVGMIPVDWEVKQIGDLEPFVTSGSRGWAAFYSERGSPFIRITNLSRTCIYPDLQDLRFVTLAENASEVTRTKLRDGDVLISITADIGIVGHVTEELPKPAYINQHIALVRFNSTQTNSRFVSYFLSSENPQKFFRALTDSGAKAGMNLTTVQKIQVAFPPTKGEQEAIAEALSDADAFIESLEQLLVKKRHLKQGAMQELLTGRKRLPGFKEKWKEKTFGEIFDCHPTATNSRDDLSPEGDTFYIHYGDIHTRFHNHLDFSRDLPPKIDRRLCKNAALIRNGDWIMVDASEDFDGIAKSVEVSGLNKSTMAVSGLHTFLLREKVPTFVPGFKGHLRNLHSLHQQLLRVATGMKVFGVSKTALRNLFLPVPPPEEQTAIATILSDVDAEIVALETKLAKARQLKQGMMQELLMGRIRLVEATGIALGKEQTPKLAKPHNWQFNEAVVISVLTKHFGSEKFPLGRKRYTKLSYLLHRYADNKTEGYLKKAAGPYNPSTRYKGPEKIAQDNGYIQNHVREKYNGFVATEKVEVAEEYFLKWYGSEVLAWLEQFHFKKNDKLELLTTVDMAMEDLSKAGKDVSVKGVKDLIRKNREWKAKLTQPIFSDQNIAQGIQTCREVFHNKDTSAGNRNK